MSIKSALHLIKVEVQSIKESQDRIKSYAAELNKLNPLGVGQELVVNGFSHHGKILVAEKVFVSDPRERDIENTANEAVYFSAVGKVKKKDGQLGQYSGIHNIKITDLI
jgi:hypothetical protein